MKGSLTSSRSVNGVLTACAAAWISAAAVAPAAAATLDGLAVEVTNASEPVLCAEKDNVSVGFASAEVKSFRIEAAHPVYAGMLQRDSFEADWTACDMSRDPVVASAVKVPSRKTIYEEPDFWLVGWTLPTYWRAAPATVRIGDRVEKGLHIVQVWMIRPMGGEEVLVVYPQDGYWRPRPLAPEGRAPTAFGSSFLVGPVEQDGGRPIVRFKELAFDPKLRRFTVSFERGGTARLDMVRNDQRITAIDVAFDKPVTAGPFAMIRSMYVTEFNNDVARIAVREKGAAGWREDAILSFGNAAATDVWLGRRSPSQHNTSSPDIVLNRFSSQAPPKKPTGEAAGIKSK